MKSRLKSEALSRFTIGEMENEITKRSVAAKLEGIDNYEKIIWDDLFFLPTKEEVEECYQRAVKNNEL